MNPGKSTKFIEHDDEIKSYIQQITARASATHKKDRIYGIGSDSLTAAEHIDKSEEIKKTTYESNCSMGEW